MAEQPLDRADVLSFLEEIRGEGVAKGVAARLLADAGAEDGISHGPFALARTDSEAFSRDLPASQWTFLETAHFRLASSLGPVTLDRKERERRAAELALLRELVPDFPTNPKKLDPWLRLHLLALRMEQTYARFQAIMRVTDADFPKSRAEEVPGKYMGGGPFLGERDKFELVWHTNRKTHIELCRTQTGASSTDALRWHFSPEHKMFASLPAEDPDLRDDRWLVPHSVHVLSHLMLCAFADFAYDPPIWLDAGLAHMLEREVEPTSTTIDGDEGSGPSRGGHRDWRGEDVRLARSKDAPTFAVMMRWSAFHDLDEAAHVACWSRVRFLVETLPEEFARFVTAVKGQLDEHRMPTGKDLPGLQRRLLDEVFDWTPDQFDEAWKAWATAPPPGKEREK